MEDGNAACPRCKAPVLTHTPYCPNCGKRLIATARDDNGAIAVPNGAITRGDPAPVDVLAIGVLPDSRRRRASRPTGAAVRSRSARGAGAPDLLAVIAPAEQRSLSDERRAVAKSLLALARGGRRLDRSRKPGAAAAAFLRRFEGRRLTQEAYAIDLADWLVWLQGAGIHPFEASFATVESYAREPLEDGRPPAPATTARRLACLAHFYRRAMFAGLIDRNPVDQIQRPRVPEQSATLGISKQKAQALIAAARASSPTDALLVLLMLELGLRSPKRSARRSRTCPSRVATGCCGSAARAGHQGDARAAQPARRRRDRQGDARQVKRTAPDQRPRLGAVAPAGRPADPGVRGVDRGTAASPARAQARVRPPRFG